MYVTNNKSHEDEEVVGVLNAISRISVIESEMCSMNLLASSGADAVV